MPHDCVQVLTTSESVASCRVGVTSEDVSQWCLSKSQMSRGHLQGQVLEQKQGKVTVSFGRNI